MKISYVPSNRSSSLLPYDGLMRTLLLLPAILCLLAKGLSQEKSSERKPALTLRGHERPIAALAFSPDGKRLASASADDTLRIWDLAASKCVLTLQGKGKGITTVAFSPNGDHILGGNWNGELTVWNAQTGDLVQTLRGHKENITSAAFSPDGKRIAAGSGDDTLRVWEVATGKEVFVRDHGNEYDISAVTFSPDGKHLVSGDGDSLLKLWNAENGETIATLEGHEGAITCLAFSHDGKHFVSGSIDDTLKIWDVAKAAEVMTLRGHAEDGGLLPERWHDLLLERRRHGPRLGRSHRQNAGNAQGRWQAVHLCRRECEATRRIDRPRDPCLGPVIACNSIGSAVVPTSGVRISSFPWRRRC